MKLSAIQAHVQQGDHVIAKLMDGSNQSGEIDLRPTDREGLVVIGSTLIDPQYVASIWSMTAVINDLDD